MKITNDFINEDRDLIVMGCDMMENNFITLKIFKNPGMKPNGLNIFTGIKLLMRKLIRIIAEKIVILLGYRALIAPSVEIIHSEIKFEEVWASRCFDDRYYNNYNIDTFLLRAMCPQLRKYLTIKTIKKFDEGTQTFTNEYRGTLFVGMKKII